MKKIIIFVLPLILLALPAQTHALINQSCQQDSDCSGSEVCEPRSPGSSVKACFLALTTCTHPNCNNSTDCYEGESCNIENGRSCMTGTCSAPTALPLSREIGESCSQPTDCKSGNCDMSGVTQTGGTCIPPTDSSSDGSQPLNTSGTDSGFVAIQPIPGLTDIDPTAEGGIAKFLNQLYKYLIGLAAAIAVVQIIRGGLLIATKESITFHTEGKELIQQTIFGLVLVLSPVLVFSIINPAILNLSINVPALDITQGSATSTNGAGGTSTTLPGNVTQTVKGTYLQTATFTGGSDKNANNSARDAWISNCPSLQGNNLPSIAYAGAITSSENNSCTVTSGGTTCAATNSTAFCSSKISDSYYFIDISGTRQLESQLRPLVSGSGASADAVGSFKSACTADGGETCISFSDYQKLDTCPEGTREQTPGHIGWWSGDSENACYKARLFCERPGAGLNSTVCRSFGLVNP